MSKIDQFKWRVSRKEDGMRLLQFLREKYSEAPSVKAIKRAINNKLCTVNNRIELFSSYLLKESDIVQLKEAICEVRKSPIKIPILYEDKELLIVNKSAGIISDKCSIKKGLATPQRILELVHRLDKETSGLLILAKTSEAKKKMIELFKARGVRKLYLAVVDGVVKKDGGKIDNFLGKKQSYQGQTIYGSVDKKKGLRAITLWRCLSRGKTASVVCCEPFTGRTHQIRVHMSEMGHPIVGDIQYGKKFTCPFQPLRNLLHAYSVAFIQPLIRKELKIIAPIPIDFKQALNLLKIPLVEHKIISKSDEP